MLCHNEGAQGVKYSRRQRLREQVSHLSLRSDVDEPDSLRDFGGVPAVGAEVEPRSRGELRDGDEACRLLMFDAVRVVHLSIQLLAGGEAAKPPLVRRNLSERALFRDWTLQGAGLA